MDLNLSPIIEDAYEFHEESNNIYENDTTVNLSDDNLEESNNINENDATVNLSDDNLDESINEDSIVPPTIVDWSNLEFKTVNHAREYYKGYGIGLGFGVRTRSTSKKDSKGNLSDII
ncbi:hypothetical protein LINPERPRIM_LOCUS32328 [Linum perenne]